MCMLTSLLLLLQELSYKYNVGGKWHLARSDAAVADNQVRSVIAAAMWHGSRSCSGNIWG